MTVRPSVIIRDEATKSLLNRPARDESAGRPSFLVTVVSGPDRGLAFELDGEQAARSLLGTGPVCTLRLNDPLVSRRHAAFDVSLERGTEGLRLQDLGSKNGTIVDGLRVFDVLLVGGETVRVGSTMLRVEQLARRSPGVRTTAMAFGRVIGASPEMRRLYGLCQTLSKASVPVLIEGETGTGKELLAEALHETGPRAAGPFVVFDCAAPAEGGLARALDQARGGTLLVDEAAELDENAQRILFHTITRPDPAGARIVVASRRDLDAEVQAGRFSDDLFRRLAAARIELPPLRRRQGDVGLLARHFWRTLGGGDRIPGDLVARLETYAWPGNVRELANVVARRFAAGETETPEAIGDVTAAPLHDAMERILELELPFSRAKAAAATEFERRYVARVLARHGGHVGRAAAASGIARRYFQVLRGRSSGR
jgi:two-component system, NtrC family, response regulator HydG